MQSKLEREKTFSFIKLAHLRRKKRKHHEEFDSSDVNEVSNTEWFIAAVQC